MVGVTQLGLELGDGPVSREAAMAEPAEDVPADEPPGEGELGLGQRAQGLGVGRASVVGQWASLQRHLHGALEGEDTMAQR